MPFTAKGVGLGEIEINIRTLGVRRDDEVSLERTIRGMKQIDASSVTISYNGVLHCNVLTKSTTEQKQYALIKKVHDQIIRAAEHKAGTPGRGNERRNASYVNRPIAQS